MGLFNVFTKNNNFKSNVSSNIPLHSLILTNLKNKEEKRNWNEVPDLYQATKNYRTTPDEGRRILPIANKYCEKYPDFDLPWLWVTSCKFMMADKEGALMTYKESIIKCKRKGGLYGTFASNYFEWATGKNVSIIGRTHTHFFLPVLAHTNLILECFFHAYFWRI
jgi:hypothetical protein